MAITMVVGDQLPGIEVKLAVIDGNTGVKTPFDVSPSNIVAMAVFKEAGEDDIMREWMADKVPEVGNDIVRVFFRQGYLDVEPGEYELWIVVLTDGIKQTIVNKQKVRVIEGP